MRFSQLLCPTLREDPAEADVISHRLMLRGGMIRQMAAGIYSYLPLGLRVFRKVERIVREEMNRAGAQEVYLPVVLPAELWRETGRWDSIGKELLRIKDRSEREYCLGPTHEEAITDIVRREIRSYRDLPKNLYQIQVKFRDEVRPRFGVMRCREFIMKDAYSFDVDDAGAEASYAKMFEAYTRIFTRCGLTFRAVEADSGSIGGSMSQEFMVLAKSGEDELVSCSSCSYAANSEKAEAKIPEGALPKPSKNSPEKKSTPGKKTVEEVSAFLKVQPSDLLKTLIYKTEDKFIAAVVPGDREVNELRLQRHLGSEHIALATAAEVLKITGAPSGFSGPIGLKIDRLVVDKFVREGAPYVVGGNEADTHYLNAVPGRDFAVSDRADITRVKDGDLCPRCGGKLRTDRGIEVGHVFKLGTKYSDAMKAHFTDAAGKLKPAVMGCYGIGIARTAAAAIEQNHDDAGMIFPPPIAPFDVTIVVVDFTKETLKNPAVALYEKLMDAGLDVLLDDRILSPGAKFKDADLIGIPVRITVGDKGISQNKLEVKARWEKGGTFIEPSQVIEWVRAKLAEKIPRI
ncbi:MAG: proline--tRNA ligase [Pseudomonadota bacterium]